MARAPCVFNVNVQSQSGVSMFKGSFVTMAEAIATHLSARAATPGPWQRGAETWQEDDASTGTTSPSMRAQLTVIRPSFSLHQVQSLPPR